MKTTVLEDEMLVAGLQAGESRAVESLLDRYGGWVHRVVRRLLNDPRDAEEVTQDVLLTVVRKIGTFNGAAAFSSWLYRIAVNAAYGRLRSKRSRPEVSLEPFLVVFDEEGRHTEPVADWSHRLEDPAVAGETKAAIERSLGCLPEAHRAVILLHDVEGLSNEQVAAVLGLTVAAVKSRVHRARLFLRQKLTHLFSPGRRRRERFFRARKVSRPYWSTTESPPTGSSTDYRDACAGKRSGPRRPPLLRGPLPA